MGLQRRAQQLSGAHLFAITFFFFWIISLVSWTGLARGPRPLLALREEDFVIAPSSRLRPPCASSCAHSAVVRQSVIRRDHLGAAGHDRQRDVAELPRPRPAAAASAGHPAAGAHNVMFWPARRGCWPLRSRDPRDPGVPLPATAARRRPTLWMSRATRPFPCRPGRRFVRYPGSPPARRRQASTCMRGAVSSWSARAPVARASRARHPGLSTSADRPLPRSARPGSPQQLGSFCCRAHVAALLCGARRPHLLISEPMTGRRQPLHRRQPSSSRIRAHHDVAPASSRVRFRALVPTRVVPSPRPDPHRLYPFSSSARLRHHRVSSPGAMAADPDSLRRRSDHRSLRPNPGADPGGLLRRRRAPIVVARCLSTPTC